MENQYHGRRIASPEDVIRRAESCSYLSDEDVERITRTEIRRLEQEKGYDGKVVVF